MKSQPVFTYKSAFSFRRKDLSEELDWEANRDFTLSQRLTLKGSGFTTS